MRHPRTSVRTPGRSRTPGGRTENGFALIVVLLVAVIGTGLAAAALTYTTQTVHVARRAVDQTTAAAAAQAGIEDYLRHLYVNANYWTNNGVDSSNPAFTTGQTLAPDTGGKATYKYRVLTTATQIAKGSPISLRVTGTSNGIKQTLETNFVKGSFLRYVYFTDKETNDPSDPEYAVSEGIPFSEANADCNRYWYAANGNSGRAGDPVDDPKYADGKTNPNSNIYCQDPAFGNGDVLNGPVHSNDAIQIRNNPTFQSPKVETGWNPAAGAATPAPASAALDYRSAQSYLNYGTANYTTDAPNGYVPYYSAPEQIPSSDPDLTVEAKSTTAGSSGCLYTGPTRITLNAAGTMTVTSPYTKSTNPGCYTGALPITSPVTVPLPSDGVVAVQNIPASPTDPNSNPLLTVCPAQTLGYPQTNDFSSYDCHNGDVWIEGVLQGQLTVNASNNIYVTGNTTYKSGTLGTDILGLVANNFVNVYHPIQCTALNNGLCSSGTNLNITHPDGSVTPPGNIEIDAALLSLNHEFTVQNNLYGTFLGTLKIVGSLAQEYRGTVSETTYDANGNISGQSGYNKSYNYDSRLIALTPPYYPAFIGAPWSAASISVQQTG